MGAGRNLQPRNLDGHATEAVSGTSLHLDDRAPLEGSRGRLCGDPRSQFGKVRVSRRGRRRSYPRPSPLAKPPLTKCWCRRVSADRDGHRAASYGVIGGVYARVGHRRQRRRRPDAFAIPSRPYFGGSAATYVLRAETGVVVRLSGGVHGRLPLVHARLGHRVHLAGRGYGFGVGAVGSGLPPPLPQAARPSAGAAAMIAFPYTVVPEVTPRKRGWPKRQPTPPILKRGTVGRVRACSPAPFR